MIEKETINEYLKGIKKDFYSFRNGIVASSLKCLYPKGKLIYGLTLPQIKEIKNKYPKDYNLAKTLWEGNQSREDRILSVFLFPIQDIDKDVAVQLIKEVETNEEAELLPFVLLKKLPYAKELLEELEAEEGFSPQSTYCLEMWKKNLYPQ